jgi:hypothetical protein
LRKTGVCLNLLSRVVGKDIVEEFKLFFLKIVENDRVNTL